MGSGPAASYLVSEAGAVGPPGPLRGFQSDRVEWSVLRIMTGSGCFGTPEQIVGADARAVLQGRVWLGRHKCADSKWALLNSMLYVHIGDCHCSISMNGLRT